MTEIAELEQRIIAALDRIGAGLESMGGAAPAEAEADASEVQDLRDALEAEKMANAQLEERIKTLHEQHDARVKELQERARTATDAALEAKNRLQQLRKTKQHLQASLQALREAAAEGVQPHLLNQTMMSELEGLRTIRDADRAELDEILGALTPLLKEPQDA